MPRRTLAILNPAAAGGRARQRWAPLWHSLKDADGTIELVETARPQHAIELSRQAAHDFDLVVAVGGDGTVNEVATGLLQVGAARAALGIVPCGTGNDAAVQLGTPTIFAAYRAILHGAARAVDAIEVTFRDARGPQVHYSLLFAAVGFATAVIKRTTPGIKRLCGPRFAYSVGFFRALWDFQAPQVRVQAESFEFRGPAFHVCAGNSEYGGGGIMRLSPGARMDDGKLAICVVEALSRAEIIRYFPLLLRGTHVGHPKVRYLPATALDIESDAPAELQLDGDVVGCTPARFAVKPGALRVVAPP